MADSEFSAKISEGIEYYNHKNIPKAIVTLRDALSSGAGEEKDVLEKGSFYLAQAYFDNGSFDEAADQLPNCGAYAPMRVFGLIKDIASRVNMDFTKIIGELPQKDLYIAIIEEEKIRIREAQLVAAEDQKVKDEEARKRKEIEGDYTELFVDTMHSGPTNYIIPAFMGLISLPVWGAGMLLALRIPQAVIRAVLQYIFYLLYMNQDQARVWVSYNINLSKVFGYTELVNKVNTFIFPGLQMVYIVLGVMFALQSFVVAFAEWYKIFLVANIVEIRNNVDIYINVGFNQHVNQGESFKVYSRGVKPVFKGIATIVKHEDTTSLVEFRPSLENKELIHPKVGDFIYYKWI